MPILFSHSIDNRIKPFYEHRVLVVVVPIYWGSDLTTSRKHHLFCYHLSFIIYLVIVVPIHGGSDTNAHRKRNLSSLSYFIVFILFIFTLFQFREEAIQLHAGSTIYLANKSSAKTGLSLFWMPLQHFIAGKKQTHKQKKYEKNKQESKQAIKEKKNDKQHSYCTQGQLESWIIPFSGRCCCIL